MIHFDRMVSEACPSGYVLDRLLAGELADGAAVRRHLAGCAPCAARLAEMERQQVGFAALAPAAAPAAARENRRPAIARRASARPKADGRRWSLAGPMAVAVGLAIAAVVVGGPRSPVDRQPSVGAVRTKGGRVRVTVYVHHHGEARAAGPGEIVQPGDLLTFLYTAQARGYLAIVSRDGAGGTSVYFADGDRAAPIEPGTDVDLPRSVVLDDVLGPEELVVLSCDRPVAVEPVRRALSGDPARSAPPGCAVEAISIEKRPP